MMVSQLVEISFKEVDTCVFFHHVKLIGLPVKMSRIIRIRSLFFKVGLCIAQLLPAPALLSRMIL